MTKTTTEVAAIVPLSHKEAMLLQGLELERAVRLLGSLDKGEWGLATDCPAWDVRAMYQHVLGACEAGASLRENLHQMRRARAHRRRHGGPLEAALSFVQVDERQELSPAQVVARLAAVAPKTIRARARTPSTVRDAFKLAVDGPVRERWTLGYLIDVIYLRDLFMHRIDASRALGRDLELTEGHDGRIVADVVAEWARRHGRPFVLELDGRAGGTYSQRPEDPGAAHMSCDGVEFCRTLSGRVPATGLLATVVPF